MLLFQSVQELVNVCIEDGDWDGDVETEEEKKVEENMNIDEVR